jgi:hypothetical protein
MTPVLFAFGLVCVSVTDGQIGRPSNESLRDAVCLEYPRALKELEAYYTAVSGEVVATEKRPLSKNSPVTTMLYRFASVAPDLARVTARRVVQPFDEEKASATAICRNKDYSFILQKTPGRAEFALKSLAKGRDNDSDVAALLLNHLEVYRNAPFSLGYRTIRWLVEQPRFSICSVAEKERDGRRALSIEFDCPIDNYRQGGYEGKLVVLPDARWVAVQFEYRYKTGANLHTGEIEYEGASGGYPIPKRVTRSIFKPNNPMPFNVTTYEFSNMRFAHLPEKELTLSAFGLPEIGAVSPRRAGGVEYWLIGAALVALSMAAILWRASAMVRRRGPA